MRENYWLIADIFFKVLNQFDFPSNNSLTVHKYDVNEQFSNNDLIFFGEYQRYEYCMM